MESRHAQKADRLERAVEQAESSIAAELVVVVAPASGNYADAELRAALLAVFLLLAFVLYGPLSVSPRLLLLDLSIAALLVHVLARRVRALRRIFTRRRRREAQVADAAAAVFTREAVGSVRDRSGILVYCSLFEDQLEILPDQGVLARVAPGEIHAVLRLYRESSGDWDRRLEAVILALGERLVPFLPREGKRGNELANRPRFLP